MLSVRVCSPWAVTAGFPRHGLRIWKRGGVGEGQVCPQGGGTPALALLFHVSRDPLVGLAPLKHDGRWARRGKNRREAVSVLQAHKHLKATAGKLLGKK